MQTDASRRATRTAAALGSAFLFGASAATGATPSPSDWQFGIMLYGWLPSVSGDVNFALPTGAVADSLSVSGDDLLDHLNMTFMATFEARRGDWSAFTDVIYLDVGGDDSKAITLPTGVTRTLLYADMDLKGWVWTLGAAYTPWRSQASHLDLFVGARLLSLDIDLDVAGGGPFGISRNPSESVDLWDGIVGAKGRMALNDRWFAQYYADVGTGGTELSWQVAGGLGYAFDWGDVTLMYRYMQYDQDKNEPLQDLSFGGGMLGASFRF